MILSVPLLASGLSWSQVASGAGAIQASVVLDLQSVLSSASSSSSASSLSAVPFSAVAVDWIASKQASTGLPSLQVSLNLSVLFDFANPPTDEQAPYASSAYANAQKAAIAIQSAANSAFSFYFSDILAALSNSCGGCGLSVGFGAASIFPNTRTAAPSNGGLSGGAIAGIIIGGLIVLGILIVYQRRRRAMRAAAAAAGYASLNNAGGAGGVVAFSPGGGSVVATMNPANGYMPLPSFAASGYGQPQTFGAMPTAPPPYPSSQPYVPGGNPNAPKSLSSYDF